MKNKSEQIAAIAALLGEDNAKRLKDAITDILIEAVKTDLIERYRYEYTLDFDGIFDEVKEQVEDEVRAVLLERYREHISAEMKGIAFVNVPGRME